MHPIVALISLVIGLYAWVVFIYILIILLGHFEIINRQQPFVVKARSMLGDMVEPVLSKIRKHVKPYNNVDWSPAILLVVLYFVQYCLNYYF